MLKIRLLDWESARAHAAPIRFAVFVEEQGVPLEIELDEMDPKSLHAVAFEDASPVGTGRLLPDGHVGRMAVLKNWRGRGVGGQILAALSKGRVGGETYDREWPERARASMW